MNNILLFGNDVTSVINRSLSTRHGTSSSCGWKNGFQYGA